MRAYSLDLRQRILDAYHAGEGSQRQLARRFKVSRSFIQNLLRRYREDGRAAPRPHRGGAPAKVGPAELRALARLIEACPEATLAELADALAEETGTRVSLSTVHRATHKRLGLTYKKRRSAPANRTKSASRENAPPSSSA